MSQQNPFFDVMKNFMDSSMSCKMAPNMDMEGVMAMQRRNTEAFTHMGQTAMNAMQAFMNRQTEVMQKNMSDMFNMTKDMNMSSPEQSMSKQMHYVKHLMEQGMSNARESAEMVSKLSLDMFDKFSKRMSDNMSECCGLAKTHSSEASSKKKSS
jgi:phasin family protein